MRSLVALLLTISCFAQAPQPNSGAAETKKGSLSGVVRALNGAPLRKADVHLRGTMQAPPPGTMGSGAGQPGVQQTATGAVAGMLRNGPAPGLVTATDAEGKFTFDNLDPGTYMLTVQKAGFINTAYGASKPNGRPLPIKVNAGANVTGIEVSVVPTATIAGKVLDEDRDPLSPAMVIALSKASMGGNTQWRPIGSAQVQADGTFSLSGLAPGKYYLSAAPIQQSPPDTRRVDGPDAAYVAHYYPGAVDFDRAQSIDVTAGAQITGMDIQLKKVLRYRVKGSIAEKIMPNSMVMIRPVQEGPSMFGGLTSTARANPDGTFEISLPPGTYTLMAQAVRMAGTDAFPTPGGDVPLTSDPVQVGNSDVEGVVVRAAPPVTVSGVVTIIGLKEAPKLNTLRLNLQPEQVFMMLNRRAPSISVAEDQTIKGEASTGVYKLGISGLPQGTYVQGTFFNNTESKDSRLDLSSGVAPKIEIRLQAGGGTLNITAKDDQGQPLNEAVVVLVPAQTERRQAPYLSLERRTSAAGVANFQNIPPGDYKLVAWEEMDMQEWRNPEVFAQFEGRALDVSVKDNETRDLGLTAILTPGVTAEIRSQRRALSTGIAPTQR